jgi:hypothetical protein
VFPLKGGFRLGIEPSLARKISYWRDLSLVRIPAGVIESAYDRKWHLAGMATALNDVRFRG